MTPLPIGILLADDNEDDVLLLRLAFRETKLLNILDAVGGGDRALAYLRRQGKYAGAKMPCLVMLDVNMPRLGGFATLREIKADPALRHLPVVILTTSQRDEDICQAYRDGACTCTAKPVGLNESRDFAGRFEAYWALVAKLPKPAN